MIEQIKQAYTFIKKWFWALPVWKRTILTSLIGAFAGSSVIGFLNRYALYYYAFSQEFRIPVEGVEYLDLAISLLSFFIILASIIATIIIYSITGFISNFLNEKIFKINKNRTKTLKSILIISLILLITTFVFFVVQILYVKSDAYFFYMGIFSTLIIVIIVFIHIFFIASIKEYFINENQKRVFTLTLVSLAIVLLSLSLFNQKLYSNFLATIHYGGKIPVEIEYRKADNTAATATGELLIRTSHSVTILNTDTCAHEEIPAERVSKIGFIKE